MPNLGTSSTIIGSFEGVESIVILPSTSEKVFSHGQFNHKSSFDHHEISLFHVLVVAKIPILCSLTTITNHGILKGSS